MQHRVQRVTISLAALTLLASCSAVLGRLSERTDPTDQADASPGVDASVSPDASDDAAIDACTAEPLASTCAGKACGPATNNCGAVVTCPDTCPADLACGSGGPNACGPRSCVGSGDGLTNCTADGGSCCESSFVTGATYNRSYPANDPATVSSFRLDNFEITVARFRKFVAAAIAGYTPAPGAGRHAHLANGGLNGGAETGWNDSLWNAFIPKTKPAWEESLNACVPAYATWTQTPGAGERRPQNCISWYQAYAFCIWDGGFLPSNAEWQLAASAAGTRDYPWGGPQDPGANTDLANHGCFFNGTGTCTDVRNISPVGAIPAGNSKYGQSDLGGNLYEWVLDTPDPYGTCVNCALAPNTVAPSRLMRGGSFEREATYMLTRERDQDGANNTPHYVGARCARKP